MASNASVMAASLLKSPKQEIQQDGEEPNNEQAERKEGREERREKEKRKRRQGQVKATASRAAEI